MQQKITQKPSLDFIMKQCTGYGNGQRTIRVHFNNGQHRRAVFARCRHQGLKALKTAVLA